MNELISICVPVYNVAPYIERCVHSLMKQTYKNIEYIFVDDSSTDNSVALLQAVVSGYPERQSAVRVLRNDRNHGLAYTRSVSIQAAQGEYVLCVDSDDYVETNAVARLLAAAGTGVCDLVVGGYVDERGTSSEVVHVSELQQCNDFLRAALEDKCCPLWGKLIRRALFELPSVHFAPEGLDYLEDRLVLLYLCGAARTIQVIDEPLCHYVHRDDSVSAGKNEKHFLCLQQYWQLADAYLAGRQLSDTYLSVTRRQKILDKVHLLHFCDDISVCRRYADLFADEEGEVSDLSISLGLRVTRTLVKWRWWGVLRLYKRLVK